uniref:Uncharacterized protein n=1 Tax=Anopheles atroparvus TaxID=41427 RepID=A0AAG5DPN8_ANOAO
MRIPHETNAYNTELLRTLSLLSDITPPRGSFRPQTACTIVKSDIAWPGYIVPASAPSCVGEPNNSEYSIRSMAWPFANALHSSYPYLSFLHQQNWNLTIPTWITAHDKYIVLIVIILK